jgi:hypothetical protein
MLAPAPRTIRLLMPKRISVPPSIVPQLALIAEQGDKLHFLKSITDALDPAERTTTRIAKIFAVKAKISISDARKIITQIMSLNLLGSSMGSSPAAIFDNVTESLADAHARDSKIVNLDKWKAAKASLEELLSPAHPLGLVQKTTRLRYEHQNILHRISILTDVRPVFDDTARVIQLMSVGYVLEIEYHDGTDRRQTFFALDAEDVTALKSACERAETKTATLKEKLKGLPWPVLISGDIDDD